MNTQDIEKRVTGEGMVLETQGKPWLTIQGEGPYAGQPAVFIRMAGCNLQCPACDTDYTSKRRAADVYTIVNECEKLAVHSDSMMRRLSRAWKTQLVVITGGEPFRQPIKELISKLLDSCFETVQIETNGTVFSYEDLPQKTGQLQHISIMVSPKTAKISTEIEAHAEAFKYVLDWEHVDEYDGLPTNTLMNEGKVYRPKRLSTFVSEGMLFVQPMDTGEIFENHRNIDVAVESCMKYGYRLSIQLHKLVGLP